MGLESKNDTSCDKSSQRRDALKAQGAILSVGGGRVVSTRGSGGASCSAGGSGRGSQGRRDNRGGSRDVAGSGSFLNGDVVGSNERAELAVGNILVPVEDADGESLGESLRGGEALRLLVKSDDVPVGTRASSGPWTSVGGDSIRTFGGDFAILTDFDAVDQPMAGDALGNVAADNVSIHHSQGVGAVELEVVVAGGHGDGRGRPDGFFGELLARGNRAAAIVQGQQSLGVEVLEEFGDDAGLSEVGFNGVDFSVVFVTLSRDEGRKSEGEEDWQGVHYCK